MNPKIHKCECDICWQPGEHPKKKEHHQMNVFMSRLNEQQKRWYAALEAEKLGRGGQKQIKQITGMSIPTIQRGRKEMGSDLESRPEDRMRIEGGGRKPVEKNSLE